MKVTRLPWGQPELADLAKHTSAFERLADTFETLRDSALLEIAEKTHITGFIGSGVECDLRKRADDFNTAANAIRSVTAGRTKLEHVRVIA